MGGMGGMGGFGWGWGAFSQVEKPDSFCIRRHLSTPNEIRIFPREMLTRTTPTPTSITFGITGSSTATMSPEEIPLTIVMHSLRRQERE